MMIQIANWNLARALPASRRAARIITELGKIEADLFVLTETHANICPRENFHGVHSGEPDRPCSSGEKWCSIWSKFQLEPLDALLSDPARCAAARCIHPTLGRITLFACVLPWSSDKWREIPTKNGRAFSTALDLYRSDWKKIRETFPDDLFFLAGDFNQNLTRHHYYGSAIQKKSLERVLLEEGLVPLTAYENDPVDLDCHPYACIAHICINQKSGLKLIASERWPETAKPDRALSDHYGIVVTLKPIE